MAEGADGPYDIAVIGAGVVGCAIARELAGYDLSVAVLDARDDVGDGTSKANTAILHTGFDASPGTLEARLVRRGYELLTSYAPAAGIPVERVGAVLVAWTEEELKALPALAEKAAANGYHRCELIPAPDLRRHLPALAPGALGGLTVPDEAITCPWTTTLAYATEARARGAGLLLGHRVLAAEPGAHTTVLRTTRGPVSARWVVNTAGLGADTVDALFGHDRFTVIPRRGELIVYDKAARPLAERIVLPVPGPWGKGVLICPTVYGNVLLGPTAEDLTDRTATGTSRAGLDRLLAKGARLMPRLVAEEVTATYAGLRAATERDDYVIEAAAGQRYLLVGGIRSTGLSASLAIAEYAAGQLREAGLRLPPRGSLPATPRMPNLGEAFPRPYADPELIARDSAYGRIVCYCEHTTEGEIRDALRSPLPPTTPGGLSRRTRAGAGRCQGTACGPRLAALLRDAGGSAGPPVEGAVPGDRPVAGLVPADRPVAGPVPATRPAAEAAETDKAARPTAADPTAAHPMADAPTSTPTTLTPDVVIVGAGPAGLTAAARLASRLDGGVLVLEREPEPGGLPRLCRTWGFGVRDLHRPLTGPGYAHALAQRAAAAGAVVLTDATVTGWSGERSLDVTTPEGLLQVTAQAVVLATGARERTRHARLIPGDRPATGIWTYGQLLAGIDDFTGHRAVIVGTDPLSWSAVTTLRRAGCRTALLTTERPARGPYAPRLRHAIPVATRTRISRIDGRRGRLAAVEIEHLVTGQRRTIPCDTLILTGDWITDHELARPGAYTTGALTLPGGGTAAAAAAGGRRIADQVLEQLARGAR